MNYKTEYKNINKMAFPILLNYLLTSAFELLDKAIIGQYSSESFALVGTGASVLYAITGTLGILSAAFNIVAAKEKENEDKSILEYTFWSSKILAFFIGVIFFVICIMGGSWFFETIYHIKGIQLQELLSYFYPASFTVVLNLLIFQYSVYFRNQLNTKIALWSTAVSTIVNLFFDYSLVYGILGLPKLGAAGAALGSILGLVAGLLVYEVTYWRNYNPTSFVFDNKPKTVKLGYHKISEEILSKLTEILKLYPSWLGQDFLENTLFVMIISGVVARLGTVEMAIYNLLDIVLNLLTLPVYAYATATQTYSLQASAKNNHLAKRYLKSGLQLSFGVVFAVSMFFVIWKRLIFSFIIADKNVIISSFSYLGIIIFVVFTKIPYLIYQNYLQGTGKEHFVLISTSTGTMITSIGIMLLNNHVGLCGVYFCILFEYGILAFLYHLIVNCSLSR